MPGAYHLLVQIEVKKQRRNQAAAFSPSAEFKMVSFLAQMLSSAAPSERSFTIGALMDGMYIQFWKVSDDGAASVKCTEVMPLSGPGGQWLYSLLHVTNLTTLGVRNTPITRVGNALLNISSCIGEGESSVVWSATYQEPDTREKNVVVKIFKQHKDDRFKNELDNLHTIRGICHYYLSLFLSLQLIAFRCALGTRAAAKVSNSLRRGRQGSCHCGRATV